MLSVDPDPLLVDEGIMRRSSLRRFVEEIIKNSRTMKNQETKETAAQSAAKEKKLFSRGSLIVAAALCMAMYLTACSASSGTTSSPKQIAAQEKFQSAIVAAQEECEKKVEAARAEAESESKR
jgi:hypothetical protein